MALGWDFLVIPNPESRPRGSRTWIFYFVLDRKIPKILKSRGLGPEFENPEWKIWNTFKNFWGFTVFLSSGFFRDFLKISGIREFFQSRDSGYSGCFLISGFFTFGIGIFSWDGISRQNVNSGLNDNWDRLNVSWNSKLNNLYFGLLILSLKYAYVNILKMTKLWCGKIM